MLFNNVYLLERQGISQMSKISLERFMGKQVVEIHHMYPILIFDGKESLTIECSWRLRNKKMILVGHSEYSSQETHQKSNGKLSDLLLGKRIKDIKITSVISDLIIEFENGLFLELFSDSNIYESWTLSDGKNFMLISLPGGKSCLFEK